ncbi:MAG: molybdopterin-dependent oxidoreductase [Melioribacteraceae bacterium]|nr:molybdopterin-dependent oxidoreductase [Melioribacteraceae bacterium]
MKKYTRREFVKVVGLSGSGLFLAAYVPAHGFLTKPGDEPKIFAPSVYLRIDSKGVVTITVHRSEMGQGVQTSLPMMVAEELECNWEDIRIEQADGDPKFGHQSTGGSQSIRRTFEPFRIAGATAKEMLISAAAIKWGVESKDCIAENGFVINKLNNKRFTYGDLVEEAAKLPIPTDVKLKNPKEYKIIGKRVHRLDTPPKIYGTAKFGIDVVIPGMFYASVARCPSIGGSVKSFNPDKAKMIKGVLDVIEIPQGIVVIADSTWNSFMGKNALSIDWNLGPNVNIDSEVIRNNLSAHLKEEGSEIEAKGKLNFDSPDLITIEGVYELPFLAHAPLEPMNCIATVKNGKAELWAPSQNPQGARTEVAKALGFKEDDVVIHVTLIGGAFGRRLVSDWAVEAALIAQATGKTIKLTWIREDDMKHSTFRPASMHKVKGSVDNSGKLVNFYHHVIAESITAQRFNRNIPVKDADIGEGTRRLAYQFPNLKITGTIVPTHVPVSWYRSVYNTQNPFVVESFIDELAYEAKRDPFEFRRDLLPKDSRLRNVLIEATIKSNWYSKLPDGKGRGIACFEGYGSFCAEVFEVSVNKNNEIILEKVTAVIDCGTVINPDTVEAQLEGAIVFALSAVLKGEITIRDGGVVEKNYDDYQILTYSETPVIESHIINNFEKVGGVGEVGIGACAPALCNAIFAACGKRVRKLPVKLI